MGESKAIHWGILGTANIARAAFLPGLRATEGGVATAVGSRDLARGEQWAAEHGIGRAVDGYDTVLEDDSIDAVYIPTPNNLHAEWTVRALRSGKAVLCEKPLCTSVEETESVLEVVRQTGGLLWEAFVFPFHAQIARVFESLRDGIIGEVREIQSNFFFHLRNRQNIRLSPQMYGGALNDVGCYPLRLAQLVFDSAPTDGVAFAAWAPEGVDEEMHAVASYPGDRRLVFSCGMYRRYDTFTRLLGTEGEIRLTNPFHPGRQDTLETRVQGREAVEHLTGSEPSFTRAIEHIHAVLRGQETPRHLALEESVATAQALALLHRRMGSGSG